MKLQYIKEERCPICGCGVIVNESIETDTFNKLKYRQHCCGGMWEHRMFACGQKISYSPNGSKIEISEYYICTNNETYKNKIQKRKDFSDQIQEYIRKNGDVDENYRKKMLDRVEYSQY